MTTRPEARADDAPPEANLVIPATANGAAETLAGLPRLGMGCWVIAGPFRAGDTELGYGARDDVTAIATLHAAREAGIRLFDTADVYGAGHAERLLGEAFGDDPDVAIVSKFGLAFDEGRGEVLGPDASPEHAERAVTASLGRLRRERIDVVLLHLNALPLAEAEPILDRLERLRERGLIGAYGWSTDFADPLDAVAERPGFAVVEHAANLFVPASRLRAVVTKRELVALDRSPLAMGLLGGRYGAGHRFGTDDVRGGDHDWLDYFEDGVVQPRFTDSLDAVRELLTVGGRTLAQGALCWLLARSARDVPIPGARTPEQARANAEALRFGPLPDDVMDEIETLIERPPEGEDRER